MSKMLSVSNWACFIMRLQHNSLKPQFAHIMLINPAISEAKLAEFRQFQDPYYMDAIKNISRDGLC